MFQKHGHQVKICLGDAVLTALKIAAGDGSHVTVVPDDKVILVMLLSKWINEMADISVRHEAKISIGKSSNHQHQRDSIIST